MVKDLDGKIDAKELRQRLCDRCCQTLVYGGCWSCFAYEIINDMCEGLSDGADGSAEKVWKYRLSYDKAVDSRSGSWVKHYNHIIDRTVNLERVCRIPYMTITIEERDRRKSDDCLLGRLSFLTKQEAIDNLMSFKPDCEVLYE